MTIMETQIANTTVRQVARVCGLIGLGASLLCWVVMLIIELINPSWMATVWFSLASQIVEVGLPIIGGMLVTVWVVVAVWMHAGSVRSL